MYFALFSGIEKEKSQQVILKVFLDDGSGQFYNVPVTPESRCQDVASFIQHPGYETSHLTYVHKGQEQLLDDSENLYQLLEQWDRQKDQIFFLLHPGPQPPPIPPPPPPEFVYNGDISDLTLGSRRRQIGNSPPFEQDSFIHYPAYNSDIDGAPYDQNVLGIHSQEDYVRELQFQEEGVLSNHPDHGITIATARPVAIIQKPHDIPVEGKDQNFSEEDSVENDDSVPVVGDTSALQQHDKDNTKVEEEEEDLYGSNEDLDPCIGEEASEDGILDPDCDIGRRGQQRNGMREVPPPPRDPTPARNNGLPGGVDLTLTELQDMAARQQQQIEHQQQVLVAKEQRLKYLKQQEQRQQQIAAENDRLRKLREKVETQEMKLKKLRALRGEVEKYQTSNGTLNSELESVKALFTEKEKELVMAVAKVEELTQQLEQIRQDRANVKNGSQNAAALELEKLRKELMIRNKLNEQQSIKLSAHREMLSKRKDEVAKMDNRIHELQQRLKKKRAQQAENAKNSGNNKSDNNKNTNRPSNVAAVEPYIQYKPHQLEEREGDLKSGFVKQDPKYQTLPPNTRFPLPENGKLDEKKTAKEQNNNTVKQEKTAVATDSSKHVIPNGPTLSQVSDSVIRAAQQHQNFPSVGPQHKHPHNVPPVVPPHTSANQNKPPPPPLPVRSATTGLTHLTPRPFGSTYSTSVLNNKPYPQAPQQNSIQNGPIINVQEDVRQGGSGQSSPASSDNSQKESYPVKNDKQVPVSEHASVVPQNHSIAALPRPVQRRQPPIPDSKQGNSSSKAKDEPDMSVGALKRAINSSRKSAEAKSNLQISASNGANSTDKNSALTEKSKTSEQNGATGNTNVNSGAKAASSKQIANIYLGRLGKGASQRYQDSLSMLYKKISDDKSSGSQNTENKDAKTAESDSNMKTDTKNKTSSPEQSPSATTPQSPPKQGHWQAFSPPGSPNHPDIASDKASHNRNAHHTPKGIRRRHSDSDNEENQHIAKLMHKHHLDRQQNQHNQQNAYSERPALLAETQATSFIGGVPENVPVDSMGNLVELGDNEEVSQHDSSNSSDGSNSQPSPIPPEIQRSVDNGAIPGKKTNLRRANSKGSGNRVSFDPLALLLDASLEGELELVKRCASQVKNVSESNDEGITALHNAICAGHYDIVTFLVEFGCDVNSPDSDGWTPLHCAASCNNLPMVIFLVEHGACIFATTISDQETAAEKCEEDEDGFDGCSEYLYSVQEKLGILNGGVVYAVFDYEAKNSDELDFRIGDEITVLRKGDDIEKEWWWSRLNGKEAYVPRNLLGLYPRVLPQNYSPES